MKQFCKILSFELKYYLKNKIFVGSTLLLVLLIAAVMFFPRISALLSDDTEQPSQTQRAVMLVKSDGQIQSDMVQQIFASAFTEYDVKLTNESIDAISEKISDGEAECAFVMTSPASYTYYVENLSMYDMNTEIASGVLQKIYQMNAMISGGMTPDKAEEALNISITGEVETIGKDQMQNFFYTYIMIFALYMVILLYGQMVATNVASEKSSRAMEVLITSAKPNAMMFGKVTASCLAGLLQLVAIFGSALVFYTVNKPYWGDNMIVDTIFNIPPELLVYMLVFFVLGFLIYAFLYGAIGSTATKLEDINTSTMPLTFLFIIAFFVVIMSMTSGNVDNTVMRVCSYIPFTSPMAMFTRIAMSVVPWYEIAASVAVLIISVIGVGMLSAKIYRVGVLLYGTPPKISAIIKAIRKA